MAEKPVRPEADQRVRIDHHEEDGYTWSEYAVVVSSWWDRKMDDWDCYAAVVGSGKPPPNTDFRPDQEAYREHPPEKVPEKPYVLRYLRTSLVLGW